MKCQAVCSLFLGLAALPLPAQTPTRDAAPPIDELAPADAGVFYRAFYVERVERNPPAAVVLYRQFLAAQPQHVLAPRARQALAALGNAPTTAPAAKAPATAPPDRRRVGRRMTGSALSRQEQGVVAVDLTKLSPEELAAHWQRAEPRRDRRVQRLRDRGLDDRADLLEERWKEMRRLADDGNLAGAQEIWATLTRPSRR
ncbi:MAG: hypothetical protein AAF628_10865 [Planctomycetota bacterium]